jgi:type 2 lantibiotic biosynthesis protein LanM
MNATAQPDAVTDATALEPRLAAMGVGALTLFERLSAGIAAGAPENAGAGATAFEAWQRAFAPGDPPAFARRLAWDELDAEHVRAALVVRPVLEPPRWTSWIVRMLEAARESVDEWEARGELSELNDIAPLPERPFLEVWVPLLRCARTTFVELAGDALTPVALAARRDLERSLLDEIGAVAELALLQRFRQSSVGTPAAGTIPGRGRYRAFVGELLRGGLLAFFEEYPVLARQVAELAQSWAQVQGEMLRRLVSDRAAIVARLGVEWGEVVRLDPALSDRHDGGRRVVALELSSGARLVYKPRDVRLEAALSALLDWLAQRGVPGKAPRVLSRPDYGWVEFVTAGHFAARDQVEEYYRRAGALLSVAHVLRGRDLHNENVVASADGPVLIDGEALLDPVDPGDEEAHLGAPDDAASSDSCLTTGFLSLVQLDGAGQPFDAGGLREARERVASRPRRVWHDLGTDDVHFREESALTPVLANGVMLRGVPQPPESYAREIVAGFAGAQRALAQHKEALLADDGPLAAFSAGATRVLFRPSDQYGALLHVLAAPRYQRDGVSRGIALDVINRVFAREGDRPRLWPLVADERRALERLDVPRFCVRVSETALVSERGERVEGHYLVPGLQAVRRRIGGLNEDGLVRQIAAIEAALEPPAAPATALPASDATEISEERGSVLYVAAAETLGRALLERARHGEDDGLLWPGVGPGWDLYQGHSGPLLLLAALASVSGRAEWRDPARAALRALVRVSDAPHDTTGLAARVGIGAGLGSAIYALVWAGRLLGDSSASAAAERLARQLTPEKIAADRHFDVVDGAAGALLALLALHEDVGDAWILERARACGRRLVTAQVETGEQRGAWPGPDGVSRAGFAHGVAGIVSSLARLYALTGEEQLAAAARRALRHERGLFNAADGNWPYVRPSGGTLPMVAWCHGAPGVGLARAFSAALADEHFDEEIRTAMQTTAGAPRARFDHVCCGNLARAEALLTVGRGRSAGEWIAAAQEIATEVARRARAQGWRGVRCSGFANRVFRAGFFQGLAGIGYALLRCAAPNELPSVLAFETGKRSEA